MTVLAHRSRWGRAPKLKARCQRGDASNSLYALYVRLAMAIPSLSRNESGALSITAESQRLINIEPTEPTLGFSPASMRRSIPRRNASAEATYCSRENSRVTLIGMPAKIASSIAGRPSLVPGILMNRFDRHARPCRSLAAARVLTVSCARSGDTSSDTHPSTPSV